LVRSCFLEGLSSQSDSHLTQLSTEPQYAVDTVILYHSQDIEIVKRPVSHRTSQQTNT